MNTPLKQAILDRKAAIDDTGNPDLEGLKRVCKWMWPKSLEPRGIADYYFQSLYVKKLWSGHDTLPEGMTAIPLSDVIAEMEAEQKKCPKCRTLEPENCKSIKCPMRETNIERPPKDLGFMPDGEFFDRAVLAYANAIKYVEGYSVRYTADECINRAKELLAARNAAKDELMKK